MMGIPKRRGWISFAAVSAPLVLACLLLVLPACSGGDDSSQGQAQSPAPATTAGSTGSAAPSALDVCGLLTADDAKAVVAARGSGPDFSFTAQKQDVRTPILGACKFTFTGSITGALVIMATAGDDIALYRTGTPIPNLGDEAFSEAGTAVVRVGKYMLSVGENSFTQGFVTETYKRMAPRLK
jgi:hypothetical protein